MDPCRHASSSQRSRCRTQMVSSCNASQSEFSSTSNECAVAVDASLTRDDLMLTAFTMNGFVLPLNVTFWNISTTFSSVQDTPPDWDTPVLLSLSSVEKEEDERMDTVMMGIVLAIVLLGVCFLVVCIVWQKDWSERIHRCFCSPFVLLGACMHTICAGLFYVLCCRCLRQANNHQNAKVVAEETVINVHAQQPPQSLPPPGQYYDSSSPEASPVPAYAHDANQPWQCLKCGLLNSAQCQLRCAVCNAPAPPAVAVFKHTNSFWNPNPA